MLLSASKYIGVGIDVTIVAVIVIFALIGLFKGFFKSILSMISTFVVLIASIFLASPCAKLLNKIYNFTGWIAGKLCKSISNMGTFYSDTIHGMSGEELANNIPNSTNGFLKKLISHILKPLSASDVEGSTVANIVSGSFASVIMLVVCAILVFILIKIVVAVATKLFDSISKNRVFGFTNKLFGGVFGACKGVIVLFAFAFTLTILTVIPKVNNTISPILQDNTKIARKIYNFSDEIMEKYVVEGEIVQKWINGLWENKYKSNNDIVDISPNGTLENPYNVTLEENTAQLKLVFSDKTPDIYYRLSPISAIEEANYTLTITVEADCYSVYEASDTSTKLTDLTALDKTKEYIIKFSRVENAINVQATLMVTPHNEGETV